MGGGHALIAGLNMILLDDFLGTNVNVTSATASADTTNVGDSIIIVVWWYDASTTISSITISSESNATIHGSPIKATVIDNATWQFASLASSTTPGTHTITVTMSGSCSAGPNLWGLVVSGGNPSGFFEAVNSATGTSGAPTASLSVSTNNALIVSGNSNHAGAGDATAGSGYTYYALPNLDWYDGGEYMLSAGSAGTKTVNYVQVGDANWIVAAAAFNGASTTAKKRLLMMSVG